MSIDISKLAEDLAPLIELVKDSAQLFFHPVNAEGNIDLTEVGQDLLTVLKDVAHLPIPEGYEVVAIQLRKKV
jgi:hypothetical protein